MYVIHMSMRHRVVCTCVGSANLIGLGCIARSSNINVRHKILLKCCLLAMKAPDVCVVKSAYCFVRKWQRRSDDVGRYFAHLVIHFFHYSESQATLFFVTI